MTVIEEGEARYRLEFDASDPVSATFDNPLDLEIMNEITSMEKALAGMKAMLVVAAGATPYSSTVRAGALFDMRCLLTEARTVMKDLEQAAYRQAHEMRPDLFPLEKMPRLLSEVFA